MTAGFFGLESQLPDSGDFILQQPYNHLLCITGTDRTVDSITVVRSLYSFTALRLMALFSCLR